MSDRIVQEYDLLIDGPLSDFHRLSNAIGGLVRDLGERAFAAVQSQRQFLIVASKSKQPNQQVLVDLLKPTSDAIQNIQAFREKFFLCGFRIQVLGSVFGVGIQDAGLLDAVFFFEAGLSCFKFN